MDTRDKIIDAACHEITAVGVAALTVGLVARRAKVSSALVHYHFATKRHLLLEAARSLARRRTESRLAAIARGAGLAGLDALWAALVAEPGAAAERAWLDLVLVSRNDTAVRAALAEERERERTQCADALAGLLASLGSRPRLPSEDLAAAVATFLDGASSALTAGVRAGEVRASYDAFWLALVALGQTAG